jgi:hypothetical protein
MSARNPKRYSPEPIGLDSADAAKLWAITDRIALKSGVTLP